MPCAHDGRDGRRMPDSTLYVETTGQGAPVLLLHGAGVAGWMWRPLLERLGEDVRATVPDLPGFGRSAQAPYVSHEAAISQLVGVLREVAPGGAHVIGFSLGAQLAILLACEHGDLVRSVGIVSGEAIPAPLPGPTLALLGATAGLAQRPGFARAQARQLAIPVDLVDDFVRDSAVVSRETLLASVGANIRFTLPAAWGDVHAPAFIVVGQRERGLMKKSAQLLAERLPSASLHVFAQSGHDAPFTAPDELAQLVRAAIAAAPPS